MPMIHVKGGGELGGEGTVCTGTGRGGPPHVIWLRGQPSKDPEKGIEVK